MRRRAQQDVEKERKFGIERFARDVLSVADNLGRALSALPRLDRRSGAASNVIVGVQATERELQSVLERHGVTRVEALGKPFNAEFHQAMMEVEDPSVPAGTVVQELIPGYLLAGRLLRAAMVAVSKGGPPRPAGQRRKLAKPVARRIVRRQRAGLWRDRARRQYPQRRVRLYAPMPRLSAQEARLIALVRAAMAWRQRHEPRHRSSARTEACRLEDHQARSRA